jgi:hypothetical protein
MFHSRFSLVMLGVSHRDPTAGSYQRRTQQCIGNREHSGAQPASA